MENIANTNILTSNIKTIPSRGVGGGSGPNNLPPLLFHQVHGENIRISWDGRTARRTESFCKGITFSARPVKINERVCVKFLEVSDNWSGVIRFGFTCNDPGVLRYSLPKYSCPDLTNKPGYWAKALSERLCTQDTILHYYVTAAGDVHFGVNGEDKGVFFSGVDTRSQLWSMIDVYGNTTAVEYLDSRYQLNNRRSVVATSEQELCGAMTSLQVSPVNAPPPQVPVPVSVPQQLPHPVPESPVYSELIIDTASPPQPRQQPQQPPRQQLLPISLHTTKGRNVRLSTDRRTACRRDTEFCGGYVFLGRPVTPGEKIFVEVCTSESVYLGSLGVGVTSCDPSNIDPSELPDDSEQLLDRPEYWSVSKDVGGVAGHTLVFCLTPQGELTVFNPRTNPSTTVLMHVDLSTSLWMFFDVYGSTQKIRMVGSLPPVGMPAGRNMKSPTNGSSSSCCTPPVTVTTAASMGGGTVLVVNLPPPAPYHPAVDSSAPSGTAPIGNTPLSDCSVCYERSVDSVLYTCGHMCMCYECAVQQWRGKGGGHCPLCRALIRDVIRTFRS